MSKLTAGQLVFLIALLVTFSVLAQLAVAKWLYERKQARLRREQAEAQRDAIRSEKAGERKTETQG